MSSFNLFIKFSTGKKDRSHWHILEATFQVRIIHQWTFSENALVKNFLPFPKAHRWPHVEYAQGAHPSSLVLFYLTSYFPWLNSFNSYFSTLFNWMILFCQVPRWNQDALSWQHAPGSISLTSPTTLKKEVKLVPLTLLEDSFMGPGFPFLSAKIL